MSSPFAAEKPSKLPAPVPNLNTTDTCWNTADDRLEITGTGLCLLHAASRGDQAVVTAPSYLAVAHVCMKKGAHLAR